MKALILAAGYGKRLWPITETIPKSMVEVNGSPIIYHTLNNMVNLGIKDIGIVVGHMAEYIMQSVGTEWKGAKITFFENKRFMETNNIVSFYQAATFFDDDILMLECDIVYNKSILEKLIASQGDCNILVSPFNPNHMDGSVIRIIDKKPVELILGKWQGDDFDYSDTYKTVNMYLFRKEFIGVYSQLVKWYIDNMGVNSYYEKVLGMIMYLREYNIHIVEVPEETWCEIDDAEDLDRARRTFSTSLC